MSTRYEIYYEEAHDGEIEIVGHTDEFGDYWSVESNEGSFIEENPFSPLDEQEGDSPRQTNEMKTKKVYFKDNSDWAWDLIKLLHESKWSEVAEYVKDLAEFSPHTVTEVVATTAEASVGANCPHCGREIILSGK